MIRLLLIFTALNGIAAERLLVDTDCGFYGDDGTTIAMLLRNPQVGNIEAITIVSGNVWSANSDRFTREILRLLKKDIPVSVGCDMPFRFTQEMAEEMHRNWGPLEFRGAFGEPKPVTAKTASRPNGVDELIRRIESAPGEMTVIALGPMTNIAKAIQQRPGLDKKIKRLIFMGGQWNAAGNASKEAEFNFWFDPEAARIVLRSAIPQKLMFGLDVCNAVELDKSDFDAIIRKKNPLTKRFAEDFGVRYPGFYKNPNATVPLWDALVAEYLIDPTLFEEPESLYLDVETAFGASYGRVTSLDRTQAADATAVQMVVRADAIRARELFVKQLAR